MRIINPKSKIKTGVFLMALVLFATAISAFSISSPYMEKNNLGVRELRLLPGESIDLSFALQNGGGTENITAKAEILEGSEIIEITDDSNEYLIPMGQKAKVNFKITIPGDAQLGEVYQVKVGFSTATDSESGSFTFGSRIEKSFEVLISEEPIQQETQASPEETGASSLITYVAIGLGVLVLGLLIAFFIIRKNKNSKK